METTQNMETSLNGLGLGIPGLNLGLVKKNAVPALIGAAGAGVALYGVDKLMRYQFGTFGTLDGKLAGLHPALPGAARFGIAVAGVPAAAMLVSKVAKVRVPDAAVAGATAVLALFGVVAVVNVLRPGTLALPGFAGAALLTETVGGPFAGAQLGIEEAGKFGGLGGPGGYSSIMGASGSY